MDENLRLLQNRSRDFDLPFEVANYIRALERIAYSEMAATTKIAFHVLSLDDKVLLDWYWAFPPAFDLKLPTLDKIASEIKLHVILPLTVKLRLENFFDQYIERAYGGWEGKDSKSALYNETYNTYKENPNFIIAPMDNLINKTKNEGYTCLVLDFNLLPENYDLLNLVRDDEI